MGFLSWYISLTCEGEVICDLGDDIGLTLFLGELGDTKLKASSNKDAIFALVESGDKVPG